MSVKTEVTRGVFDPRTYREADPVNWARKRRSDWLAVTGKIHYVRERTVASQERELAEQAKKEEERKINQDEKQEENQKKKGKKSEKQEERTGNKGVKDSWPRRKRSDITLTRCV